MKNDIYTLAHEIRNPLCVVKGYLEMLNENNISKYKTIIENQVNDSLNILNDYLEYSRITLNKEELDLNVLLLDLKKNLKDYLKSNNVYLHLEMIDDDIYSFISVKDCVEIRKTTGGPVAEKVKEQIEALNRFAKNIKKD